MPIISDNNQFIPAVLSITSMAKLLHISRSRFYQLINQGILLPPVYSLKSKRPFYTQELAQRNLEVKRSNVGINGEICLFYCNRNIISPAKKETFNKKSKKIDNPEIDYSELKEGLKTLGLIEVKSSQIQSAISECFPDGTENTEDGEVLRTIFLSIKRRNSTDNVDR